MGTYASTSDVQARVPYRTIGATTEPTITQVSAWIDQAESKLEGMLRAGGITVPITDSDGIDIMLSWATDYGEGRARRAWAASGGDGANLDGQDLLDNFEALLLDMAANPLKYEAMLTGSMSDAQRERGYVNDNADEKSITNGDFDPQFTVDDSPGDSW